MQTVLLAAGDGESIAPLSESKPKPLLPVAGEPLIEHTARAAVEAGATAVVVVVPPYYQPFTRELGEAVDGVPVTYAVQPRPMGTAKALVAAKRHIDDDFVVLCGDTLYDPDDLRPLYDTVPSVGVTPRAEGGDSRVMVGDGGPLDVGTLGDDDAGTYVATGACAFPAEAREWTRVPTNDDGERDVAAVVERTAEEHDVRTVLVEDYVDVDRPWDLLRATEHVLGEWADAVDEPVVAGDVSDQARLHGPVRVEDGAEVRAGVVVEGPVVVDEGATVGPNAYVRPNTYLGEDVAVGHSVEVRNSVVMSGSTIERLSYVGDSVLGPDVTFGAGTKVADLQHEGGFAASSDGNPVDRGADARRFGVVAGEGTRTAIDTSLDAGLSLPCGTTTAPGENVLEHP